MYNPPYSQMSCRVKVGDEPKKELLEIFLTQTAPRLLSPPALTNILGSKNRVLKSQVKLNYQRHRLLSLQNKMMKLRIQRKSQVNHLQMKAVMKVLFVKGLPRLSKMLPIQSSVSCQYLIKLILSRKKLAVLYCLKNLYTSR